MAKLDIVVELKDGAHSPSVKIDHLNVPLNADRKGSVTIPGTLGDGSNHNLTLLFQGPAGAKASSTVTCGTAQLCQIKESTMTVASEPYRTTWKDFKL